MISNPSTGVAGKRIVILGGGITGLATAYELARLSPKSITIIDQNREVGGLAGTVRRGDLRLDLGSHRIHPNYEPYAMEIVRKLLGDKLIERPRLGRILVNGRFLGYPPTPLEILKAFGPGLTTRFTLDYFLQTILRSILGDNKDNFESFLIRRVGKSLYEAFYLPYAKKLWNTDPRSIHYAAGKNRAKKFELSALFRGIHAILTGRRAIKRYFYPAGGIGQIAERFAEEIRGKADLILGGSIKSVELGQDGSIRAVKVGLGEGAEKEILSDIVVSTISLRAIHELTNFPSEKEKPSYDLQMRSLRILYIEIDEGISGDSETVYIPNPGFRIGRVSQISRYSPGLNRHERGTILALEMICTKGDETWTMPDERLAEIALDELRSLRIIGRESRHSDQFSAHIENLYPVFSRNWERSFSKIYSRVDAIPNLFMVGRPALFLHCNIDHCIVMANALARHLESGKDKKAWNAEVASFHHFQVKD